MLPAPIAINQEHETILDNIQQENTHLEETQIANLVEVLDHATMGLGAFTNQRRIMIVHNKNIHQEI